MSHDWSKYQLDLFQAGIELASQESGAIVVDAKAGAAKTSSSAELMARLPRGQRVQALCFNKHSAMDFQARVPCNVEAATLNSFGWRTCRAAFRGVRLDDGKTRNVLKTVVLDEKLQRAWHGPIKRLIGLKKASLHRGINGKLTTFPAGELLTKYDIEAPTDPRFLEAAGQVWKQVIAITDVMDYDDQIFMPIYKNLPVPQTDWVFVDEAQDLSKVQVELVQRIAPRVIAVGDPNQSIYMFRGADPDSMDQMTKTLNAKVLPLSISYRCARSIVREAQKIVPSIEPAPNAREGAVDWIQAADLRPQVKSEDWILCRTTAPLIKECLKMVVAGIKASVKGRDIGQQIISLIEKVNDGTDATAISDFSKKLDDWFAFEQQRLAAAQRDAQLQALEDRVESVHALSEGTRTVGDVKARINSIFSDEQSPGVTLATAHRSKGLEAENVFILRPDLMPFKMAKSEDAKKQENNLKYVAITRAMGRLVWVHGDPKDIGK